MKKGADVQADGSHGSERGAARHAHVTQRRRAGVSCFPPDVLIAMDVDPMELVLQVLVFHVRHVIDHFQDDKPGEHGQHEPLLEHSMKRDSLSLTLSQRRVGGQCRSHGALH